VRRSRSRWSSSGSRSRAFARRSTSRRAWRSSSREPPIRMAVTKHETRDVRASDDVVRIRQAVREWAVSCGFSLVGQTKIVTAASTLARNVVVYGGGGTVRLESLNDGARRGLRLVFEDQGPGIPDIGEALRDGFT